jgi:uncharacterized membrane protein
MESLLFLVSLLALALLVGAGLGWVAFFKVRVLQKQITGMQRTLHNIVHRLENTDLSIDTIESLSPKASTAADERPSQLDEELVIAQSRQDSPSKITQNVWTGEQEIDSSEAMPDNESSASHMSKELAATPSLFSRLRDQWMIWLGGISIGLSGIFMVRYSIEQGLLGPLARVLLSIFGGLILHCVAEWGRRRNHQQYQALAALAGGASIILYSALIASLNLYNLFPAGLVFVALIVVSLATMALAVLHGPVLAIMGILGAYVIPLLVDTGSDNVLTLYIYSVIVTAAALLLMRYVYRPWLWSGMLAGSLGWWLLTIDSYDALGLRGYYLAALLYLFLAMPNWDWLLRKPSISSPDTESIAEATTSLEKAKLLAAKFIRPRLPNNLGEAPGLLSIAIVILAFGFTISVEQTVASAIFQWTPFVAILLVAAGSRPELLKLVALSLGVQFFAWLSLGLTTYNGIRLEGLIGPSQFSFVIYAAGMAFIYTALSLRNLLTSANRNLCCALAVASPLVWLSLCYLLASDLAESIYWGAAAVGLGIFYLLLAAWRLRLDKLKPVAEQESEDQKFFAVWLILAGHFAYSLAVAIMVREAGLTLALSAQILSISWLIHRYNPPRLDLFLKLVLAVVVMRLTLNPWLLTYPVDVHWSFWTYGGATLFAALGAWRLRDNAKLGKWLELASLHLLVLTLWAETRYTIYDGEIFKPQFDLVEFSINTALWSSLSLVYYLRHSVSQNLKSLYLLMSKTLLVLGLGSYLAVLLFLNPFFTHESVSSTPIFNILLLSYGLPVVIGSLLYLFYERVQRRNLSIFIALSSFIFINVEIRHLWSGTLSNASITSNGELYTYTIVWLILAIACLLGGSIRFGTNVYRAGFGLMMLVIGKIFLFDMADLEGLLRVASFMGLGLSLLGLAYLYQRFNLSPDRRKG